MNKDLSLKNQRGQTVTEFALVLPLLVLLLFAVIQFGIVFNNYVTLTDAVRAGARKGAVGRHLGSVGAARAAAEAQVRDAATDLDDAELDVTVAYEDSAMTPGSDVVVEAEYPYSISLFGVLVKSGQLKSETTERVE